MGWMADESGLDKTGANHVALTPLSHLRRAAQVFSGHMAVIYGAHRVTYAQYFDRCSRLASALSARGVVPGDVVATLLPNLPAQAEAHFGVPACGAVLNTINTRLDVDTVAYIFDHGGAKIVLVDPQFLELAEAAVAAMEGPAPELIEVADDPAGWHASGRYAVYEDVLASADPAFDWVMPTDEWESLALNYTSGTTGRPKGVVYHHRGAYLMAIGTIPGWSVPDRPVYLSIVPMFHCNGWNHPWANALVGAKIVFTRDPIPERILDAIVEHGVTHFGGAPIVLQMLTESPHASGMKFDPPVQVMTAGAPPPPSILEKSAAMGMNVMQVYGLTETYGHITQCLWRDEWDDLSTAEQAEMQAMQGVAFPSIEDIRVVDRETGEDVPADGETQGEIAIRGNPVMKGYYKDPDANSEAFQDGYFWSGDAAVRHPNSYIQVRDRLKDVIISGGENISSVEVEAVVYRHPSVQAAAIVAQPHERWGEVPCAFVELREGHDPNEADIMSFCKEHLAGFKTPKSVVFGELPKTSTGKIQKFLLREKAKTL